MTSTPSRLLATALAAALVLASVSAAQAQRHPSRHHDDFPGATGSTLPGGLPTSEAANRNKLPFFVYPPPYLAANPHTDWCLAYRPGYNPYDNTFQGYHPGERMYCRSPYGG